MGKRLYRCSGLVVLVAVLLAGCTPGGRDAERDAFGPGEELAPLTTSTLTPEVVTAGELVQSAGISPIETPISPTEAPPSDTPLPLEPVSPLDTPALPTNSPSPTAEADTPVPIEATDSLLPTDVTGTAAPTVITGTPTPTTTPGTATATPTATPTASVTATPQCPAPTPEHLWVEPVTSPTDQLSQTVVVHMGNMEAVTITAESGVFASAGPAVEVALLRNTVHHLEVVAKVRLIEWGGCKYGGYTLRTSRDKNGARLVIEQGQPAPPPQPNSVIGPDNVSQLQPLFALAPDARLTTDFAFESHDTLVSVGYDDEIVLWSLVTGQESGRLGDGKEEAEATCLALTSDRSRMATCGTYPDWGIRLWSMATGGMSEFDDPEAEAGALAFSPSGSLLASGSNDNVVWIWDVASREAIASFAGDVPQRNQMFHGFYWLSEQVLVAAGSDAIYWWDVSTGEQLERLVRPEQALFFVDSSFTQEGDRLAAAAQDDNVYVWSPDAGTWSVWPAAAGLQLSHVAFSPDGRLLAAVSFSGHLLLWNAETEELAASWNSNGGGATVRFSHDGRYIAAGGWDSPVWLWGIPLLGNTEMMVDDPDGKRTSHRSKHRR